MKKILFQFLSTALIFFSLWYLLSKVDWLNIFDLEKRSETTEQKLGDLFWDFYNNSDSEIKAKQAVLPLDTLVAKICVANQIDHDHITLHLVHDDEINAFALPNKHLIVNSGLVSACENEAELSGVIAHEIAHMENDHVMKKLIKEVGLSVLVSITMGNGGGEKIKEVLRTLSSSAYDRNLEKEADIKAVDYLTKANINPEPFANFLYRLGESEGQSVKYLSWISTHPDSKERAAYIIEYMPKASQNAQSSVLAPATWQKLKSYLED